MMGTTFLKDRDWAAVDGQLLLVKQFTALASLKNGQVVDASRALPYAEVQLSRAGSSEVLAGFITHRIDFAMLWAAFRERSEIPDVRVCVRSDFTFKELMIPDMENEEVWIVWTRKNYGRGAGLFRSILPKLVVMVSKAGAYGLLHEIEPRPGLSDATCMALVTWLPEVMNPR